MGIAIPLIGIVVTVVVGGSGSDGDSKAPSANTAPAPEQRNTPPGNGTSGSAAAPSGQTEQSPAGTSGPADRPAKVLFGPGTVTATTSSRYVDLDTSPPLVTPSGKAADLVFGFLFGKPDLVTEGSSPTLAPLPAGGPDPTAADCAEAVRKRGSYLGGELALGSRFCAVTDEGRTAYVKLTSVPAGEAPVRMEVTVWDPAG
ncbi:hypothetical protein [Embleya hyalina]|uniref:hypothetical protein n=1 Tax=Embleya hyalina TaxID=516124 RepID=UPI000F81A080|nr:hypothetical protein [Embleya hyalina]